MRELEQCRAVSSVRVFSIYSADCLLFQSPAWPPRQREVVDAAAGGPRRGYRHRARHRQEAARRHHGHPRLTSGMVRSSQVRDF